MSDPLQKLTPRQVTAAGLADWRQAFHGSARRPKPLTTTRTSR